jgi:hypothetical protein
MPRFEKRLLSVLVLLSFAAFLISSAFGSALDLSLGNTYVGSPIAETSFANLTSTEPSVAMFPGSPVQTTEDSIFMHIVYNESELANLTEAVDSALLFMDQFDYLSSLNFTLDDVWSRLESAEWSLRFYSANADVYIGVNAVTCSIDEYHISWIGPSPYVRNLDSNILSAHDIELATIAFFEQNNLILSPHSYYVPATLENNIRYLTHNVYAIVFFEVVNGTLVSGNVIEVYLDVLTGAVVSFDYQWVYIDEIPTSGAMDKSLANDYASEYINQESAGSNYRVTRTVLMFKNFGSLGTISYTLCWAIYTDNSEYAVVYVNAKSGDIISSEQYVGLSSFLDNTRIDFASVVFPFILSVPLALAAFMIANYLGKKSHKTGF